MYAGKLCSMRRCWITSPKNSWRIWFPAPWLGRGTPLPLENIDHIDGYGLLEKLSKTKCAHDVMKVFIGVEEDTISSLFSPTTLLDASSKYVLFRSMDP